MDAAPDWLPTLTEALAPHLVAAALPAPMGAHVHRAGGEEQHPDGVWEVSLFYGRTEIVAGPQDGRRTDTAFWLNLAGLAELFDRVDAFYWQASPMGPGDDLGPHVAIEGEFLGNSVRVRILAAAPPQFPAARSADTLKGTFIDLW
jgi:hypothetical protein